MRAIVIMLGVAAVLLVYVLFGARRVLRTNPPPTTQELAVDRVEPAPPEPRVPAPSPRPAESIGRPPPAPATTPLPAPASPPAAARAEAPKVVKAPPRQVNRFEATRQLKREHPALHQTLVKQGRLDYLEWAGDVDDCAAALMERLGRSSFFFNDSFEFTLNVSAGKMRVIRAQLVENRSDAQVDPQFLDCYQRAVMQFEFDCPGCPDGTLPWSYALSGTLFKRGEQFREMNVRDPATDPGFVIRGASGAGG